MKPVVRELDFAERATWGDCPVCRAKHGEPCNANVGLVIGRTIHGAPPCDGAHLGRLRNAPLAVKEVPVTPGLSS